MTTATRRFVPLMADDLRALNACQEQVTEFARRFPNGATPDDADRADGLDASWLWLVLDEAAYEAVQQTAWAAYVAVQQTALAAYQAVQQTAWAAYEAVQQPAWAAYVAVRQPAFAAYQAVQQPALAAYVAVEQPAWAAYQAVQQPAFAAYQARLQSESLDALRELWPVWEVAP